MFMLLYFLSSSAAAKSLQSCPTLCNPIDGSSPGSPIPGILQARTLEWAAISFSNAWKWKVKVKSLSRVQLSATPWTAAYQAPPSRGFPGKSTRVGYHHLLHLLSRIFEFHKESDTPEWLFLSQGLYWRKKISISSPRPICHPARTTTLRNVHITHKQSLLSIISVWITSCSKLKRVLNIYSQVLPWQSSG